MRVRLTTACLTLLLALPVAVADDPKHGPDSAVHPDVPQGKVTKHTWHSDVFPGTVRDYWVYVPAQYDPAVPREEDFETDGRGIAADCSPGLSMVSPGTSPAPTRIGVACGGGASSRGSRGGTRRAGAGWRSPAGS